MEMQFTQEKLKEMEKLLEEGAKQKVSMDKISWYAKSLRIPLADVESWSKSSKIPNVVYPFAHEWQRRFTYPWELDDFDKFKDTIYHIFYAGNQGGKSVGITNWPMMECLGIHPLQEDGIRPKPPVHWWIVSPNLPSESDVPKGEDAPILKTIYEWVPESMAGGAGIVRFYRKDKIMTIRSVDGKDSVVNFKSHDQEKSKFKSERLDGIAWDEMPPYDQWREGIPRILSKKGIFLLGMTPDYSSVWTADLVRKRDEPEYRILEMDSLENPFMPVEHRKRVLATMSEDELQMRRFGKHIQFKGKVFPFDYHKNVGRPFTPSRETTNYVIIDWHPAKPIIITYLAINMKNIWYVFKESVIEDHVVEKVAREYFQKITFPDYRLDIKKNIIDKIANIEQAQDKGYRAKSIVEMLRGFDIKCDIGLTDFNSAQAFVSRKLNYRELYFDPQCKVHIEQFDTWGAKRYQKGNLEGTMRDQLEPEGNDTCMNLIYAYNAGAKFFDTRVSEFECPPPRRPSTERLYGRMR